MQITHSLDSLLMGVRMTGGCEWCYLLLSTVVKRKLLKLKIEICRKAYLNVT